MCPVFEDADKKLESLGKTLAERHAQQRKLASAPLSLCQCVYAGDIQAIREHVSSGKSLSPEFVTLPHRELFMTPMQVALLNQYFDIAQFLLDNDVLFPENVCDWMVAQSVSERKARREAEAAAKAAQEELTSLRAEVAVLRQHWLDRGVQEQEAAARQLQAELDRVTADRDQLTRMVDELKMRADVQVLEVEGQVQRLSWMPSWNGDTGDVDIMEVPNATGGRGAADAEITKCMQQCSRMAAALKQTTGFLVKAQQAETAARSSLKETMAIAEIRASWTSPLEVSVDNWYRVQVDLEEESKRSETFSVAEMKSLLAQLRQMQDHPAWMLFRELLSELYAIGNQIMSMLVAGHISDSGYVSVIQGVLEDLRRAITAEPIAIYLINLHEQEEEVKKAVPRLQERRTALQESDPITAEQEAFKVLEIIDGLLQVITLKIDVLKMENSEEVTKLSGLVAKSSELISKVKAIWGALAASAGKDSSALQKAIKAGKEVDLSKEAGSKQRAFTSTVHEIEKKQDALWASMVGAMAQLEKLQEDRTAVVQHRLGEIWALQRREKVNELMITAASEKVGQLEALLSRCAQAEEVTAFLARFVSLYSGKMGNFLKEAHNKLHEKAPELHQLFYHWFTLWVKDHMALAQAKKQRLDRLQLSHHSSRPSEADLRTLEKEIASLEAALKAKMAFFDSPGRTGEYLKQHGIPYTHPILLTLMPKKVEAVPSYMPLPITMMPHTGGVSQGTAYQYSVPAGTTLPANASFTYTLPGQYSAISSGTDAAAPAGVERAHSAQLMSQQEMLRSSGFTSPSPAFVPMYHSASPVPQVGIQYYQVAGEQQFIVGQAARPYGWM
eukprot:GGOE01001903.1.p1 GENE.GGOE01001903.1~~GGOE01001903.1.p1  ORF type:complete len:969 (-),score=319.99 GGOE01001903.1:440-2968(-)